MAKVFGLSPPLLSNLVVDVDKDWESRRIRNLGTPVSPNDAAKKSTVVRLKDIYSRDYGLNWADLGAIAADRIYSMCYLGNGIVILGEWDHIWRSTDYGATWTDLGLITGNYARSMCYLGNGVVLCGDSNGGVWRSTDYGLTWADVTPGGSVWPIYAMAYLGNGFVICGDADGHVWRSIDYGLNWADLGAIALRNIVCMAYLGNGVAILGDGDDQQIWRSTDYGLTWATDGPTGHDIYSAVYLGDDVVLIGTLMSIYRSIDGGDTWTDSGDISTGAIWVITYLGNGVVLFGDQNGHVFRSTDHGENWTDLGAFSADDIYCMAYLDHGIALVGEQNSHVWRSTSAFQLSNFNPNQFDKVLQFGCLGAIGAGATSYLAPGNGPTQANEIRVRVSRPGILRNLYVWQRVASGVGGRTDIYTVRVNGANTAITCTLDNAVEGADIVNEVVVAAGDQVSISLVSNNGADTSADVSAVVELM